MNNFEEYLQSIFTHDIVGFDSTNISDEKLIEVANKFSQRIATFVALQIMKSWYLITLMY